MKTKPKKDESKDRRQTDLSLSELIQEFNSTQDVERLQLLVAEIGFIFCNECKDEAGQILTKALGHENKKVQLIAFSFLYRGRINSAEVMSFADDPENKGFVKFLKKHKAREAVCCN